MAANFGALKAQVESAMDARTDIPDFVYSLANAEINELRLLVQQATTTLTVSSAETALPADFRAIDSAYVDASPRVPLMPADEHVNERDHRDSGAPRYYAIVDGALRVNPTPDGTYSVVMRYYARLADFSADGDTNDVLTGHPTLYHYAAAKHAAIWAGDQKRMASFAAAYQSEKDRIAKEDRLARFGRGLSSVPGAAA